MSFPRHDAKIKALVYLSRICTQYSQYAGTESLHFRECNEMRSHAGSMMVSRLGDINMII